MKEIFLWVESLFSGMLPFAILMIAGIYFTFKTRAVQLKKFGKAMRFCLKPRREGKGGISSFGAVCNSLAATVGTGNIAGVAAAISTGGAGAVFWMWVSAFVSMVIKSAEIILAVVYRKRKGEVYQGGPMYYLKEGLGKKFFPLATLFAVAGVFSAFTTGNITQVNAFVSVVSPSITVRLVVGIAFGVCVAVIIMGGAKKITRFTTFMLPFMAVVYIVFCFGVIITNAMRVDDALHSILRGAFCPSAVTGGVIGSLYKTVICGAQKGVFSNEAGMGTAGMAHAAADDARPETQGLFGIFEVFVDTWLICTLTALTILCSGVIINYGSVASSGLVKDALSTLYGDFSAIGLAVMLGFFAVSSVVGWAAYGIDFVGFLLGERGEKFFVKVYPVFCVLGAVMKVDTVWRTAEFFNGIMLVINVFALLVLSDKAVQLLKGETNEKKNRKLARKP